MCMLARSSTGYAPATPLEDMLSTRQQHYHCTSEASVHVRWAKQDGWDTPKDKEVVVCALVHVVEG
jgi:hypothetical protein